MFAEAGLSEMTRNSFATVIEHLLVNKRRKGKPLDEKTGLIRVSRCFLDSQTIFQEALKSSAEGEKQVELSKRVNEILFMRGVKPIQLRTLQSWIYRSKIHSNKQNTSIQT